jgi:hypothetical protein
MMTKKFSELTLTQQRAFANRFAHGLPFLYIDWLNALQELDTEIQNCRVKGSGWGYVAPGEFVLIINYLINQGKLHGIKL